MKRKKKSLIKSFRDAMRGIKYTFDSQRNFRIQVLAMFFAIILSLVLKLDFTRIAIILFAGVLVLSAELINTAIERFVDLVEPNYNPLAGKIKDISAGFVLVSAILSVIIGFLIFIPAIINFLN